MPDESKSPKAQANDDVCFVHLARVAFGLVSFGPRAPCRLDLGPLEAVGSRLVVEHFHALRAVFVADDLHVWVALGDVLFQRSHAILR